MNAPKAPRNQGESPPDDGVIDLTDPITSPFEDDAPIIELTHRVNTAAVDAVARPPAAPAEERPPDPADGRIPIDLLDDAIVLDDAVEATEETDDFVDSLGLEIGSADEVATASVPPADAAETADLPAPWPDLEARVAAALPPERIEAALERVIERIYAEKLEGILVETVERVVKREIEEIQAALLGDEEA